MRWKGSVIDFGEPSSLAGCHDTILAVAVCRAWETPTPVVGGNQPVKAILALAESKVLYVTRADE
jgi:hypothetical protein